MKRHLTAEQLKELQAALKNKSYASYHRRIQCLLMRSEGMTLQTIAHLLGFAPQIVQNQVRKYQSERLVALLTDKRGGCCHVYLSLKKEQIFLKEQFEGVITGDYVTIDKLYRSYQARVGKVTTREGFYALLKRHVWRKVSPRPQHPKKADAKTILASKNKIFVQEAKKAFQEEPPLSQGSSDVPG